MSIKGTKFAGSSVIAFSAVSLLSAWISGNTLDCISIFLLPLGFFVRSGRLSDIRWAMGLSIFEFFIATASVSSAFAPPIPPIIGIWLRYAFIGFLGLWSLLNAALLYRLNWYHAFQKEELQNGDSAASQPANQPFQFSLRSLLFMSLIFAIACWMGTLTERPLYDTHLFQNSSVETLPDGTVRGFSYGIVYYDPDNPLIGYLCMESGNSVSIPPGYFQIWSGSNGTHDFRVNGKSIRPTSEFQLFVNDLENKPLRMTITKGEIKKYFGEPLSGDMMERLWHEVVEPRRRAASTPAN